MPIDLFNYRRRTTTNVHVGRTPLGSNHPVRLQSMNTTSTDDVEGSIAQAGRIISAGADYVRLTTQGLREVESLLPRPQRRADNHRDAQQRHQQKCPLLPAQMQRAEK